MPNVLNRGQVDRLEELVAQVNTLTKLLCIACEYIEGHRVGFSTKNLSVELDDWWKNHKKQDEGRKNLASNKLVKLANELGYNINDVDGLKNLLK